MRDWLGTVFTMLAIQTWHLIRHWRRLCTDSGFNEAIIKNIVLDDVRSKPEPTLYACVDIAGSVEGAIFEGSSLYRSSAE